jgi:hypothetical protein
MMAEEPMIPSARPRFAAICACLLLSVSGLAGPAPGAAPVPGGPSLPGGAHRADPATEARVQDWLEGSPAGWTPNRGQVATADGRVASEVLYSTAIPGAQVYVTRTGLSHLFVVAGDDGGPVDDDGRRREESRVPVPGELPEPLNYEWARVDLSLVGATIHPELAEARARIESQGTQNFYLAHCPDGVLDVPTYAEVSFPGVYPGVDWLVRSAPGDGVHHDFVVAPGADPDVIRLRYDGATSIRVSDDGQSLVIRTALGDVREGSLLCHQGDLAQPVSARFELSGNEVRVRVGNYDRSKPLVIDPPLVWSTYYGGTFYDGPRSIWCDNANGTFYVVGYTGSFDLPAFNPGGGTYYQGTSGGDRDAWIWKFSQAGQRLWATYYGGSADEGNADCALDAAGNLYVGGTTTSSNLPLQVLGGAFNDGALGGQVDGFFVKFNSSGVRQWASYLGGTANESLNGITVDPAGRLYACGFTNSTDYPLANPGGGAFFQPAPASTNDAFVTRFATNGVLDWSTYLGGTDDDYANGILATPAGTIFVTGTSLATDFPVFSLGGAYNQAANAGAEDAFIAQFSGGAVQQWTTYYGGSGPENGDEPAIDASGNVYLYGVTGSTDLPTLNSGGAYYQPTFGGSMNDLFLVRFNGARTRTWATYIGGNGIDTLNGPGGKPITVDNQGRVILTGVTDSSDYPLVNPGGGSYFLGTYVGFQDAVITQFAANGAMIWSTYWGTTSTDFGTSVSTNADGCIYATGESVETGSLVNVTPGFWAWNQPANAGSDDGYIAKFCTPSAACCIDFTCVGVSSAAECNLLGGTTFFPGQPCSTTVCAIDCTICGTKFQDLNRDGVKQGTEPGLAGWTIQLNYPGGAPYATTVTDGMGNYCFTGVPCGNWEVAELHQPGWVPTYPGMPFHALSTTTGSTTNGVNFGNYQCPTSPPCATPPTGLAARWVFGDDPLTGVALDVAHTEPVRNAAQLSGGGSVPDLLCLGSPADMAVVPGASQLDLDFDDGSFSMAAWLNMEPAGGGARMLVDKRAATGGGPGMPPGERGWAVWLDGMQSYLSIATGGTPQVVPGPILAIGQWTHLVVSVDRTTHEGRWYMNGIHESAFDFTPIDGFVGNIADLTMGQPNAGFGGGNAFHGCVADLALFHSPISADAAYKAWIPGPIGVFCPEYALMPAITNFCPTQTSKQVCFKIANNTAQTQSYTWSLAPLPAGPGCTVAGPTQITPSSGTVTVPAGNTSANICVTITRPAGMTAHAATACFQLTFVNNATGVCRTKTAKLRADNTCWCATPTQSGVVGVPARVLAGSTIGIGIELPCDPVARAYQWRAVWLDEEHPDPHAIRLNGLPPGEPVIGTLTAPAGGAQSLDVQVSYGGVYDPTAIYEIVLEADTDGDGSFEPVAGTVVHPLSDTAISGVEPPVPVVAAPRVPILSLAPNPFAGRTTVAFTLPIAGDVDLGIYDLAGRLVRRLQHGPLQAGSHRFEWDGRSEANGPVSSGVYFVRLTAGDRRVDGKIVKAE